MNKVRECKKEAKTKESQKCGSGNRWKNKLTVPKAPRLRSEQRARSNRRNQGQQPKISYQ